jgi:membrane fusion protein, multidrug efflux system
MKTRNKIITIAIVAAILVVFVIRLIANKRIFDAELNAVSDFNINIPVNTDTVKDQRIAAGFVVNGSFCALHEITVSSETQGRITSIAVRSGDHVTAGQVLASTDNELAVSQYELAKANFEKAEKDKNRYEQLSHDDAVTVQQSELAKLTFVNARSAFVTARKQLENSVIKAPVNGIITKKYVEKGMVLTPNLPAFDIVEIDRLKFMAKLTSDQINKISRGQTAKVTADNYPSVFYDGKINAIVVKADLSKRYEVEIEVTNHANQLIKPGMFGSVFFGDQSTNQFLAIPRKALTGSIKTPQVFVVKGDSVILRNIDAEPLNDRYMAVKQGLKEGDVIVVSGQINLKDGSRVKVVK